MKERFTRHVVERRADPMEVGDLRTAGRTAPEVLLHTKTLVRVQNAERVAAKGDRVVRASCHTTSSSSRFDPRGETVSRRKTGR